MRVTNRRAIIALAGLPAGALPELHARSRGSVLTFDGLDDYVVVPDTPCLDLTGQFKIAALICFERYTECSSMLTKGELSDGFFDLGPNNYTTHRNPPAEGSSSGRLRFTGSPPTLPVSHFAESDTTIPLGKWHFVAVMYNGTTLRSYLDGRPDCEDALPETVAVLVEEKRVAGVHSVRWGPNLPNGFYFYRMHARSTGGGGGGNVVRTQRVLLLKCESGSRSESRLHTLEGSEISSPHHREGLDHQPVHSPFRSYEALRFDCVSDVIDQ